MVSLREFTSHGKVHFSDRCIRWKCYSLGPKTDQIPFENSERTQLFQRYFHSTLRYFSPTIDNDHYVVWQVKFNSANPDELFTCSADGYFTHLNFNKRRESKGRFLIQEHNFESNVLLKVNYNLTCFDYNVNAKIHVLVSESQAVHFIQ